MTHYPDTHEEGDLAILEPKARKKSKRPPMYRVMLLNDDYTTMDFVIYVLQTVFKHDEERATQIMLHIHQKGLGVCGVFTRELAESKVDVVMRLAKQHQHPLQCTMEPDVPSNSE